TGRNGLSSLRRRRTQDHLRATRNVISSGSGSLISYGPNPCLYSPSVSTTCGSGWVIDILRPKPLSILASVSTTCGSGWVIDILRPKSLSILGRGNECLDHLGVHEITVELIQLRQPKVVA